MVVKTETCFFTERRIYPGHGSRFVRRDARLLIFINHKSTRHYHNKKRAQSLRWTIAWRRAHKKVRVDHAATKKFVKKTQKTFKSFVGLSIDDLQARAAAKADLKKSQADAAQRSAKKGDDKKKAKKAAVNETTVRESRPKFVASRINKAQARK